MSSSILMTPWGETLDREHVLPEYPRPQMARSSYINLNGTWDCSFTADGDAPGTWQPILVPFSPEAPLSGVGRMLMPGEFLWYRRTLPPFDAKDGSRMLLHFGAVDQQADVYVNGKHVAYHMGGYTPFDADVTDALTNGENELLVRVQDDTDASWHSRGKQKMDRGKIWYTPQSGIWQTVWIEQVPALHVTRLTITPVFDQKSVRITVHTSMPASCTITLGDQVVNTFNDTPVLITPKAFHPWSPEDPYLYPFSVTAGDDRVESYFALRQVDVQTDASGVRRLFLNGKPYFHTGMLDQGYWPDGLYTAPSDEALIHDIVTAKAMGFNMLRKHIKVEPLRWYYHCDRLGMLVWQDMVNGGRKNYSPLIINLPMITDWHVKDSHYYLFCRQDAEGREEYYRELEEMIRHLYNCPSIVMWVPFNEGWGQFDAGKAVQRIKALDNTRVIDHASGWNDQGIGEFKSLHVYFMPYKFKKDKRGRAVILTEFGGYNLEVPGHMFNTKTYGYKAMKDNDELLRSLQALYRDEIAAAKPLGLTAAVYTQVSDVEDEINGLMTYDRKVTKLPAEAIAAINAALRDLPAAD